MSELPDPAAFGDYANWPGREVHGPGGRVGTVVEIYLDDATDRPEWVLVELEEGSRFVPLADGSVEGETIRVAHSASAVTGAPDFGQTKELSQDQERRLYDHYSVPVSEEASDSLLPEPEPERAAEPAAPEAGAVVAPEPAGDAASATPEPEPARTPEAPAPAAAMEPDTSTEPVAALPPEGETSEPENQGPPVPPRPEPVAPTPPPTTPPQSPPRLEAESGGGKPPATIIASAAALAILLLIILRRRS
jgi:hypothetical protein